MSYSLSATVLFLEVHSQALSGQFAMRLILLAIRLILFAAPFIFVTVCGSYFLFFRFRKSVGQSFCFHPWRSGRARHTFTGITVLNNRTVDSIAVRHSGVYQTYNYRAFGLNPFDYCALWSMQRISKAKELPQRKILGSRRPTRKIDFKGHSFWLVSVYHLRTIRNGFKYHVEIWNI